MGVKGFQLFYKAWLPDNPPRAVLVIVHGSGEHIDRYKNLVDALVPAGFLLTGYDQRGHGRSDGQRGHIDSWDEYREDLQIFLAQTVKLASGRPLFLFGHSMGSEVMLDYILHYSAGFAGAISSGTPIELQDAAPPFLVLLAKALSGIWPKFSLKLKLEGSRLSRNPRVAQAYMDDPLVHWYRSARWATESLKVLGWIKNHASEINLPVLFLHGERDPFMTAAGAQRFFEHIQNPDKTIHIYPEGLHEPHNDLDYKQVISDIESWMDNHIAIA